MKQINEMIPVTDTIVERGIAVVIAYDVFTVIDDLIYFRVYDQLWRNLEKEVRKQNENN